MSQIAEKLNANENFSGLINLWALVVGLAAIGVYEYFKLTNVYYYWFSIAVAGVMTISIVLTTVLYTLSSLSGDGKTKSKSRKK